MKKYYIVLSSVTTVQRMSKVLEKNQIRCSMIHTPHKLSAGGCSYSLILDEKSWQKAVLLAEQNRISVKAVYENTGTDEFTKIID